MTTSKPYHGRDSTVAFKRPTVGARVYLVVGGTGWTETYIRKQADEALAKLLHPLSVSDALTTFQAAMELEAREENWEDVMDFLGKITGQSPKVIPEIAGVGFWGQIVALELQQGTN